MKNMMRFGWVLFLIAMTVGSVLAQEGAATSDTGSNNSSLGLMMGIFILGVVVIAGVGIAMNSQQNDKD